MQFKIDGGAPNDFSVAIVTYVHDVVDAQKVALLGESLDGVDMGSLTRVALRAPSLDIGSVALLEERGFAVVTVPPMDGHKDMSLLHAWRLEDFDRILVFAPGVVASASLLHLCVSRCTCMR